MSLFIITALLLCICCLWWLWPTEAPRFLKPLVIIVILPGVALFYGLVGDPQIISVIQKHDRVVAGIDAQIDELRRQVLKDHENPEPWMKMGSLQMEAGRTAESVKAFQHAVVLSRGHPAIILLYAKALIAHDEGRVSEDAYQSLKMVLLQDKENIQARYWLAVYYVQHEQREEALGLLRKLHDELPDMAPIKAGIAQQIKQLENK